MRYAALDSRAPAALMDIRYGRKTVASPVRHRAERSSSRDKGACRFGPWLENRFAGASLRWRRRAEHDNHGRRAGRGGATSDVRPRIRFGAVSHQRIRALGGPRAIP